MESEQQLSREARKGTINHILLLRQLGDAMRVLVLAPRRSGKTESLAALMESVAVRRPWLALEYRNEVAGLEKPFRERHAHLFRACPERRMGFFVDNALHGQASVLREMLAARAQHCWAYATLPTTPQEELLVEEMRADGFLVVEAPLLYL